MTIPDMTAQQFAIIDVLLGREMKGRELRAKLAESGFKIGGPAFYQMMSRLGDAGFVTCRKLDRIAFDTPVTETSYKVTGNGERAFYATRDYYVVRGRRKVRYV